STRKGYRREDLWDSWQRYVPHLPPGRETRETDGTNETLPADKDAGVSQVPLVSDVSLLPETRTGTEHNPELSTELDSCAECQRRSVFKSGPCPDHRESA